jgi:hypothetical protein
LPSRGKLVPEVVVAEQLHYRRLLAEIERLVGRDEAEQICKGLTTPELAVLKEKLVRRLMRPGGKAA